MRRAVVATKTGRIALGTAATIASHAYQDSFAAARDTVITAAWCSRFADFAERGVTSGRQILGLAQGYLEPLQQADVDTVVLGCTHYPLLSGVIALARRSGDAGLERGGDGQDVFRVLTERDLLSPHTGREAVRLFQSTGDSGVFLRGCRRGSRSGGRAGPASVAAA